jgi:hypothetical protein
MSAIKRGYFVIRNAESVVILQGIATTMTNDTNNIAWRDVTEVNEQRDALNVPRTYTEDFRMFEIGLTLTPGSGSNQTAQSDVKAAIATLRKMDTVSIASTEDADMNWTVAGTDYKAFIWEVGKTLQTGANMSVDVTVRRIVSLTESGGTVTETPVAFGAWAAL